MALGALRRCVDWPVRILAYASMDHYFLFEVGSKDVSRLVYKVDEWLLMMILGYPHRLMGY